jgi:hypothetical protein
MFGGFAQPDPNNPIPGIFAQQRQSDLQREGMHNQKKGKNVRLMMQLAGILLGGGGGGGAGVGAIPGVL